MGLLDSPRFNRFLPRVGQGPALYEEGSPLDTGVDYAGRGIRSGARALGRGAVGDIALNSLLSPGGLIGAGGLVAGRLGRFLTSAPRRPIGDEARGMGMIEGEVPGAKADVPGVDTANPAVMGARNGPSPVDAGGGGGTGGGAGANYPENGMFPEYRAHEVGAAASARPSTRAIRLPGGKFLFTNRGEYGGEETSVGDAGREIRGAEATPENVRMAEAPRIDPTSATMSSLVRASVRSGRGERAPGMATSAQPMRAQGRMTAGISPDVSGGAVSMIEGTPQQQLSQRLEDALGALSLSNVEQQGKVAAMDPAEAALLGNPQVQASSWALNALLPRIEQAQKGAQAKAEQARQQIQDPKQLAQALRVIQDERDQAMRETQALLSVLLGVRPQTI